MCAHVYIHVCIQFHLVSSWFHSFRSALPDHPSGPPFRTTLPDNPSGPFASAHDDMHLAAHQALLAVLRDGKHTCTILSGDATQAAFRREFIVIHGGVSLNIMGFYGAYWDAYQIL